MSLPPDAIRRAVEADLPALHALVERAYRGDSARRGWTHEPTCSMNSWCSLAVLPERRALLSETSSEEMRMTTETATLAAGCFWCIEAVFDGLAGVESVESGYIGGHVADPDYRSVCGGSTGHAEAVRIVFDNDIVSFDDVLDIFFEIHDPTQLNRQGNDVGTQYRSAIFPHSPAQEDAARAAITRAQASLAAPVVTTVEPLSHWYVAEDYHQEYFEREGARNPYCQVVVAPKLTKFRKLHADRLKSAAAAV